MSDFAHLTVIGVNTGNSLDAADVILTKFGRDGSITDLDALSVSMSPEMADCLRHFRSAVMESEGDMPAAKKIYDRTSAELPFDSFEALVAGYTSYVADAVNKLVGQSEQIRAGAPIDAIGFHGQTCAHQPPSIARDSQTTYTIQIGDGQQLANETRIPVVYDFRSDDVMNGGEGAPLAPVHHEHLARHLMSKGKFPIAFLNAGNTGNISVISSRKDGSVIVSGWDAGPFNDYPDKLMQLERGKPCDLDGAVGGKGKVQSELLRALFDRGVVTEDGANFLLQPPPKSSDPQWYRLLPELTGETSSASSSGFSFEDRLRTAEYFAAYVLFFTLKWIPSDVPVPHCFAVCGGGWNNSVTRNHFELLVRGEFSAHPLLPEHEQLFSQLHQRITDGGKQAEVAFADQLGFSGQYMEARIFADAAFSRIVGMPFSRPETTGCRTPTILGIIRYPQKNIDLATRNVRDSLSAISAKDLPLDEPNLFDGRWSRAARGWSALRATT